MASIGINTDIKGLVHCHLPQFTPSQPVIPKRYVMPWKQDMKNRKLILKNAEHIGVSTGPHEESLYLEHRERLCHGERVNDVLEKSLQRTPGYLLFPPMHSQFSRYCSSLIRQANMP
ncbi:testis-expressed protein 43 [Protopterus annectens]|uniref:testis-expressed protein 43 n=1 Tax=Protopterus annectens TaxID=7888 RepID=UPI001CF966B6|nr:testis-expressed protein 43 [Protopterus annectens]